MVSRRGGAECDFWHRDCDARRAEWNQVGGEGGTPGKREPGVQELQGVADDERARLRESVE